jgi:adenine phosphoribosyltransferase
MDYDLEYGSDTLEMAINETPANVVIIDDVIATGGTLRAAIELCRTNNYNIKSVGALINLKFLNDLDKDSVKINSILNYD